MSLSWNGLCSVSIMRAGKSGIVVLLTSAKLNARHHACDSTEWNDCHLVLVESEVVERFTGRGNVAANDEGPRIWKPRHLFSPITFGYLSHWGRARVRKNRTQRSA
jgi:hypothetical protein